MAHTRTLTKGPKKDDWAAMAEVDRLPMSLELIALVMLNLGLDLTRGYDYARDVKASW